MADDKKISELNPVVSLAGTELFAVVQAGETKNATISQITFAVGGRTVLSADTDYYVNDSTGSDSNDGSLTNPWLTIQHALDTISFSLDIGIYDVTVHVADGTYAETLVAQAFFGSPTRGAVKIEGNEADPTQVIISAAADLLTVTGSNSDWWFSGFTFFNNAGVASANLVFNQGNLIVGLCNFDGSSGWETYASLQSRAGYFVVGAININNNVSTGWRAGENCTISHEFSNLITGDNVPITFLQPLTCSEFILLEHFAYCKADNFVFTNPGDMTGKKFRILDGAYVAVATPDLDFFPGDAPGDIARNAGYDSWFSPVAPFPSASTVPILADVPEDLVALLSHDDVPVPNFYYNDAVFPLGLCPTLRVLTDEFSKDNDTLDDIAELSIPLAAAGRYKFKVCLMIEADATGGFQAALSAGSGGTLTLTNIQSQATAIDNGTSAIVISEFLDALDAPVSDVGPTEAYLTIEGTCLVNEAGKLVVQFAQAATNNNSMIFRGSSFEVQALRMP